MGTFLMSVDSLSGEACGMRGFRVCFDLLITILGTPEDGLAKLHTPRPPCSTTAFPGSPNGFSLQTFSESPFESSSLCIIQVQGFDKFAKRRPHRCPS